MGGPPLRCVVFVVVCRNLFVDTSPSKTDTNKHYRPDPFFPPLPLLLTTTITIAGPTTTERLTSTAVSNLCLRSHPRASHAYKYRAVLQCPSRRCL